MVTTVTVDRNGAIGRRVKIGPFNFEQISGAGNIATATSTHTKNGSSNPSWRKQVRAAVNATTSYGRLDTDDGLFYVSASGTNQKRDPFWAGPARFDTSVETIYGALGNNPRLLPPSFISNSSLDIQARISFVKKAQALRRSFQGGVFLGELRETLHMIRRPAEALRNGVDAYVRNARKAYRKAANSKAAAKALSNTWLEHAFGWRPLLSDVDDAMKALARQNTLIVEVVSSFASADGYANRGSDTNGLAGFFLVMQRLYRTKYSNFVRYKGAVGWESGNKASSWRENWGLTLDNFAPTVWELIPYSFLVDYFTNIGDIIDTASFGTVNLRWGTKAAVSKAELEVHVDFAMTDNPPSTKNGRVTSRHVSVPKLSQSSFVRTPIGGVSVGIFDFQFRCPGVGSTKWLNIGALAAGRKL